MASDPFLVYNNPRYNHQPDLLCRTSTINILPETILSIPPTTIPTNYLWTFDLG